LKAKTLQNASFWTALIFFQAVSGPAAAEPISVKGIDWSMSTIEILAALESDGLTCLRRPTWNTLTPNSADAGEPTKYFCIDTDTPVETERSLDHAFESWRAECQLDRSSCWSGGDSFKNQLERLLRVTVHDDDRVIFDCSYTNSCGFGPNDILHELQRRVHQGPWEKPTEDSFIICTTGPINEALCVHWHSKAILLFKQPITSRMDF